MKRLHLLSALLAFGLIGVALADTATKKKIVLQHHSTLKWSPVAPGVPVLAVDAWKAPQGAFCRFAKVPKGLSSPKHFHTNDLHAVVLEGQWGAWAPGETGQYATAGGYLFIPGGTEYLGKCGPSSDCVVYECGPAAFDVQGIEPTKQ